MILEEHLDIHGRRDLRVLRHAFLNSYYQTGLRNVLDEAILRYGEEYGLKASTLKERYRKVDEIPFDVSRRRMSVVLESHNRANGTKRQLVTKGAVEEILSICSWVEYKDTPSCGGNPHQGVTLEESAGEKLQVVPLTEELRERALSMVRALNEDDSRVLAVAQKNENVSPPGLLTPADEKDMVLMGFLAFLDPPKETASKAIKDLQNLGVTVKIVTGDNDVVAQRICKEVGISVTGILRGEELARLSEEELIKRVEETTLFAKITPIQKARIVQALRKKGHIVGFLGDGINDAPAMKEADVSISVENAADIAKESADFILLEKSLSVLKRGIELGRTTFGNIMKYIAITASSNFGNVFSVLVASVLLPFLPMLPLQFLFLNLTYDISMIAIPWDRVDREYVRKPQPWDAPNVSRFMIWLGPVSSVFDLTCYALMYFLVGPLTLGAPYFLLPEALQATFASLFQAGWFVLSLWTQTMVVYMLRTEKIPFLQSSPALPVLAITLSAITFGTRVPCTALGERLSMVPLPGFYFLAVLIPCQVLDLFLAQKVKTIFPETIRETLLT